MIGNKGSKSLLPLIEIIIALCIFIIAAIITVQLFFLARFMGEKTKDKSWIVLEVQNIVEEIKAQKNAENVEQIINSWDTNSSKDMKFVSFSKYDNDSTDFELLITYDVHKTSAGSLYSFEFNTYKMTPYPFIDDKHKNNIKNYSEMPFTDTIYVKKFVTASE